MIGFLWRIIVGRFSSCQHKWNQFDTVSVFSWNSDRPIYYDYHQKCEKCGKLQKVRL